MILAFAVVQSLISLAQPANDDPCGAIPLTVQTGSICTPSNPYSWTGATNSTVVPAASCASYSTGDIWFSFIAPASGKANINTAEGTGVGAITDAGMEVWGNAGSCSTPTFFYIFCDDDSGPGNMPAMNLTLTPGALYYIRIWDYYDNPFGNIGGVCVTDPNPPLVTTGGLGVGIQNPDNLLDVNGVVKIRGGNPGLNKVLTSDANGVASWVIPVTPVILDPIPFKGTHSADQSVSPSSNYTLSFNTEEYDPGSVFAAGTFFVPADGIYHFDAAVMWLVSGITSTSTFTLMILRSGSLEHAVDVKLPTGTTGTYSQHISADISLTTAQTVQVRVYQNSAASQVILGYSVVGKSTYFDGHRVK